VLTSGLPCERSGSSGFIDVPTIVTTQIEISYKLNGKLLPAAAACYVERTRRPVAFVQTSQTYMSAQRQKRTGNWRKHSTFNIEHPTGRCFADELNVGR
jgi:hypothetical protein